MEREEQLKVVAERLRRIRKFFGRTQKAFAESIGVDFETYANYERARFIPKAPTLKQIESATGYSADYILGNSDYFGDNAPEKGMTYVAAYTELKIVKQLRATSKLADLIVQSNTERIVKVHLPKVTIPEHVFGVVQSDDSMDGGRDPIRKGAILILDYSAEINIGSLVVVKIFKQPPITRKVVNINEKEVTLAANDPAIGSITVARSEIECMFRVVKSEFHQEH